MSALIGYDGSSSSREALSAALGTVGADRVVQLRRSECLQLLRQARIGRIAVSTSDRTPVIRPVNYIFDEPSQSVVFRTAAGSKFRALLTAGKAAFEIDGIGSSGRTGWSVIVSGVAEEITMRTEIERLMTRGLPPRAPSVDEFWVRIRAFTVSGRRVPL